jgi:hypothetical protein
MSEEPAFGVLVRTPAQNGERCIVELGGLARPVVQAGDICMTLNGRKVGPLVDHRISWPDGRFDDYVFRCSATSTVYRIDGSTGHHPRNVLGDVDIVTILEREPPKSSFRSVIESVRNWF